MKAHMEMEVKLHTFLLSALDEKWSASRPDRFTASEPVKKWMKRVKRCKHTWKAVSLKNVSHPRFIKKKLRNKNNKKEASWQLNERAKELLFTVLSDTLYSRNLRQEILLFTAQAICKRKKTKMTLGIPFYSYNASAILTMICTTSVATFLEVRAQLEDFASH